MQKVEYKKTIPKYEVNTFKRYGYDQISPKYYYYSNSSKNKNYFPSSEEEKTNSKSNYKISDINKTTSSRYKFTTKMGANNQFSNSQNLFNDIDTRPDSYKLKTLNQENSSIKSNRAYISLNSLIQGRNSNSKTKNYFPKMGSDIKNKQNYSNHKIQNLIDCNSNDIVKENIYNKNNDKYIYNTTYKISKYYSNLSSKIIENDSNVNNSHHGAKIGSIIQENDTNEKMILNTSRRKNYETKTIMDYKNKNEISKTDDKKYSKNSMYQMERRENNLSINIKRNSMKKINDFRGGQNSKNLKKKDIISIIPNTKGRNEINELKKNIYKDISKRPDMNKIKKISLISVSNLLNNNNSNVNINNTNSNTNNLNESSQKNITEKTNHSFYEVKSLTKESPNQKNDSIIPKTKKITMRLGSNNTFDLTTTKKAETNLKTDLRKFNEISSTKNKLDNNRRNKNNLKERKINLCELNKCLINEGKIYLLTKENNKTNLEKMIKNDMIIGNNYIKGKKEINNNLYRDSIKIKNIQIKKQEDNNGRNRNKIIEIINKRNNSIRARNESLSQSKIYKFRTSDIISYNLSYIPGPKEDKNKNNNNKIKGKNKKKINIFLKNLNCKLYEEDLKPDMENNKYKYKVKKIGRRNGNLKPQIGVRITLFNVVQPERKRYYYMNFFYSENLRNHSLSKENEFYF